jgi:glycosyltransferase involved in cell wall biosynthesis
MMNAPSFSIIVPVYNKGPHISRSLSSVMSQTFKDFELIVVCDPSNDNSNEEVAKFDDSRIRVFQRNQAGPGGYAARNLGAKYARSNWLTFLDADDEWMPEHLESLLVLMNKYEKDTIFSSRWEVVEGTVNEVNKFSLINVNKRFMAMTFKEYLSYEVRGARPIWTSVVCIKKDLLKQAGFFPEGKISMGGDIDTWLRCVSLAGGCVWSNHIGAIYHRDSVNMVTKNSIILPELHLLTTTSLLNQSKSKALSNLIKIRANNVIITAWNHNMRTGGMKKNFRLLGKLFFVVQPVKVLVYIFFSMLPIGIQKPVHRVVDFVVSKVRQTLK